MNIVSRVTVLFNLRDQIASDARSAAQIETQYNLPGTASHVLCDRANALSTAASEMLRGSGLTDMQIARFYADRSELRDAVVRADRQIADEYALKRAINSALREQNEKRIARENRDAIASVKNARRTAKQLLMSMRRALAIQ